jgi:hypothetical protein
VSACELRHTAARTKRRGEGANSATAASGTRAGFADERIAAAGSETCSALDLFRPVFNEPNSIQARDESSKPTSTNFGSFGRRSGPNQRATVAG